MSDEKPEEKKVVIEVRELEKLEPTGTLGRSPGMPGRNGG
jgi:hypothetical protein